MVLLDLVYRKVQLQNVFSLFHRHFQRTYRSEGVHWDRSKAGIFNCFTAASESIGVAPVPKLQVRGGALNLDALPTIAPCGRGSGIAQVVLSYCSTLPALVPVEDECELEGVFLLARKAYLSGDECVLELL